MNRILAYIVSLDGSHATLAQIVEYFGNEEIPISRTTVYRHLDKLVESGKVRKYTIDRISGACFQYVTKGDEYLEHFHLKCECCVSRSIPWRPFYTGNAVAVCKVFDLYKITRKGEIICVVHRKPL